MRARNWQEARSLEENLIRFSAAVRPLRGIISEAARAAFVAQLIDSIRRIRYVQSIRDRQAVSPSFADPSSDIFDPVKGAKHHEIAGNRDEAFWLVFLSIHFGKSQTGWRYVQDIYGALGIDPHWTWSRISADPDGFRGWLAKHQATLKGGDGVKRRFNNHRKYQSLSATSPAGTGAALTSYVAWVLQYGSHDEMIRHFGEASEWNKARMFDAMYHAMDAVASFGRMAKFDFLTMLGKLGLAPIEPGSTYMHGATGPYAGALLFFTGVGDSTVARATLDEWLIELNTVLELDFGMQVLEDALCNWQKSPDEYKPFRG